MSLRDSGQLTATPPLFSSVPPSAGTGVARTDAKATATTDATAQADANKASASWSEGACSVIAVDTAPPASANTAAQKITAPSHWECPAPGTTGANLIAVHSAATGIYAFGSGLLIYFTVEATKACLATLDSNPSASRDHRTNAIVCGIGAGAFLACGVAWGLTYLKTSIEKGMIHRHA